MEKFGMGQPVRRAEDVRLVTGQAVYTDDFNLDGQAFGCFLRSPHAHAKILSLDTTAAKGAPGVIGVFTGKDIDAAGDVNDMPCNANIKDLQGNPMYHPPRRPLESERVRFVGDLIAIVVAETHVQARDAVELIEIEYEELPSVVDTAKSIEPDAAQIWPEANGNLCVHFENKDGAEIDAIIQSAPNVAKVDLINNRLIAAPMEPRVAIGDYDSDTGTMILYAPSQGANRMHSTIIQVFPLEPEKIHVISKDTGGGFGVRSKAYAELIILMWTARQMKQPVKWQGDRFESMVSDNHSRDNVTHAELPMDENGRALGLKIETIASVGAYLSEMGPGIPTHNGRRITGTVYKLPEVYQSVHVAFSNTTPTDSYRGAGRPEAAFIMESLMEEAAKVMGMDPIEIRNLNFIPEEDFPYTNSQNLPIDSGKFTETMNMAMERADWDGIDARRAESKKHGKLRGIGLGYFMESSGGRPDEFGRVRMEADGSATILVGTFSHGQGHGTAFRQILHDATGLPFEQMNFIDGGDTAIVPQGRGTGGSRSSQMGGVSILRAAKKVIIKGKVIAAHLLQTGENKVEFASGVYTATDSGASISLSEVAMAAHDSAKLPDGMDQGLDENEHYQREADYNYPNGAHIAEVEIDPETGVIKVDRYSAVDDSGVIINPMLFHGQVHGAIAQGLGQALYEHTVYDDDTGQFLSGSFMDYCMPRASMIPDLNVGSNEVRCTTNDLGVKGAGEGGCCGAPPAVMNAVLDALKDLGVTDLAMPLTPMRVWQAIQAAK
jgi:carbon-monoxide dehydrogenase large subunit